MPEELLLERASLLGLTAQEMTCLDRMSSWNKSFNCQRKGVMTEQSWSFNKLFVKFS